MADSPAFLVQRIGIVPLIVPCQGHPPNQVYRYFYFHQALSQTTHTEDSLKLYLNLARTHSKINQLDSVRHYNNLISARLTEIKDNYIMNAIYATFSEYYKETGDYKEALRYSGLEKETNEEIQAENKAKELYEADKKIVLQQNQKWIDEYIKNQKLLVILSFGLLLLFSLIAYLFFAMRHMLRKQKEDMELLEFYYYLRMKEIKSIDRSGDDYKELAFLFLISNKGTKLQKYLPDREQILHKDSLLQPIEHTLSLFESSTDEQNILWAKKFLNEVFFCGELITNLSDRQILFFALCSIGFTNTEIATVNNISIEEVHIYQKELEVSLIKSGLAKNQINTFLYNTSDTYI